MYLDERIEKIKKLSEILGFIIENEEWYMKAITCESYANEYYQKENVKITSNRGLSTVGDAILKAYIAIDLLKDNPDIIDKEITEIKQELENNEKLQQIGKELKLDSILCHSNSDLLGNKGYATAIEAIIAAIYMDKGVEETKIFIKKYIIKK